VQGGAGDWAKGHAVGRSDMRKRGGGGGGAGCADDLEEAYSRQTTITRERGRCGEIPGKQIMPSRQMSNNC